MSAFTEPLRYRILLFIADIIKTVDPMIDGFYHSLADDVDGPKVFVGRKQFGNDDRPPFVSILENRERQAMEEIRQKDGLTLSVFSLIVQTWGDEDELHPSRSAYRLSAEVSAVLKRYETEGDPDGGLPFFATFPAIYQFKVEPPLVNVSDQFSDITYSMQRVDLWLAEDLTLPYDDA